MPSLLLPPHLQTNSQVHTLLMSEPNYLNELHLHPNNPQTQTHNNMRMLYDNINLHAPHVSSGMRLQATVEPHLHAAETAQGHINDTRLNLLNLNVNNSTYVHESETQFHSNMPHVEAVTGLAPPQRYYNYTQGINTCFQNENILNSNNLNVVELEEVDDILSIITSLPQH